MEKTHFDPVISIDQKSKCSSCGDLGTLPNGLCLKCATDELEGALDIKSAGKRIHDMTTRELFSALADIENENKPIKNIVLIRHIKKVITARQIRHPSIRKNLNRAKKKWGYLSWI